MARYVTIGPAGDNWMAGVLNYFLRIKSSEGYSSATTAEEVVADWDGTGKVVIVTGASAGLGSEATRVFAMRGAEVVLAVRDVNKAQGVIASICKTLPQAKLTAMELALDSLDSVRAFAKAFQGTGKRLDVLMLNAGVMACPFTLSNDGHEQQFATNHLGHFLLTKLLLPTLEETAKRSNSQGRIVVLASSAHFNPYPVSAGGPIRLDRLDDPKGYSRWPAYGASKLANVLFARELSARLEGKPVVAACCHPGVIKTELARHINGNLIVRVMFLLVGRLMKSIPQGTATQMYLATAPAIAGGEYYADCTISLSSTASHDAELGRRLWDVSDHLVAG